MALTADALWLNTAFASFDYAILNFLHRLADSAGTILTPLCRLITLLGEKGLLFFLLAVVLMLFPKWRRTGVCIFGAVCCGALISNILLKDAVARPRPFEAAEVFRQWWQAVGAPAEDGFSFPSGHVTAAVAGVTGLCLMRGRKWILPGSIWVLLMMLSRNYLMAHYPSDVIFALLIGIFSGFVAAAITQLIFRFLEKHSGEGKVYDFLLYAGFEGLPSFKGLSGGQKHDSAASAEGAHRPARHSAAKKPARHTGAAHASPSEAKTSGSTYRGKH